MATFTSKAAGNWSASGQTTWNESGVPGNGDTVTITHAITVDANTTVGSSPTDGGTAAIATSANLTIATGVTLTCRGDITLNSCQLIMSAGSTFRFDASQAGTPSTALYVCQIGTGHSQSSKLVVNGTSGSRCTITSVTTSSAAFGRFTDGGFIGGGQVDVDYCDFSNIGDSSNNAFAFWIQDGSGRAFRMENCTLDACGTIASTVSVNAPSIFVLSGVTMKNSTGSNCINVAFDETMTTGSRTIESCVFDKNITTTKPIDVTITGSIVSGVTVNNIGGKWAVFSNNLFIDAADGDHSFQGDVSDSYFLENHAGSGNHFLQISSLTANYTIDGNVFEAAGSSIAGDCILIPQPSGASVYTIKNNLVLPNAAGDMSGTLISALGNANVTFSAEHNTVCVSGAGSSGTCGVVLGETYAAHAGMCSSVKSNLFWASASGNGYKVQDSSPGASSDAVSAANCTNNGGYNLNAGAELKGYNVPMSGTPGTNDVTGNPSFADSARNLAAWAGSLGGTASIAFALAELKKRNDASNYNSNYNIEALIAYVKAGFVPQSATYDAAHDNVSPSNGWIGAVEGMTGTLTPTVGAVALTGVAGRMGLGISPQSARKGT